MKKLYFRIFDAIYRLNLNLKPAFETEVIMTGFQTGIYIMAVLFFLIQGTINIRTGNQSYMYLYPLLFIFVISILVGFKISWDDQHPYNSKQKRNEKSFRKSDWFIILTLIASGLFYYVSYLYKVD